MKKLLSLSFLIFIFGCAAPAAPRHLPNGYKVWTMNAQEIYLADSSNELMIGPGLREVGVAGDYILTYSEPHSADYKGNLKTEKYSVLDSRSGMIETQLSEQQARDFLSEKGKPFPVMLSFDSYAVSSQ